MRVLVIEDEPQAARRLQSLIKSNLSDVVFLEVIDTVKKSIQWFQQHEAPDLIFMDVQLADGISFQIFDEVKINAPIIFTTAYDEYALKAFKVNSIDYILKPVDDAELAAAIAKYKTLQDVNKPLPDQLAESIQLAMSMISKKYKERFVIKVGEHLKSIETSEILFFFSLEKTSFAQTRDGRKHILDFTLDQLEGLLDPKRFFRINRKYIVSIEGIHDMISYTNSRLKLVLKTSDDQDIIVARERVQEFKNWLDR
jgi:DNA-binding LytR/AlgR family response regulator